MTDAESSLEVVRWYTRARRFPQLIGRFSDGTPIPFGPFTFTQVIGVGVFLFVAVNTVSAWGQFGLIGNVIGLAAATFGVGYGLGRIPLGARNPLSLAEGVLRALTAARTGTVSGRAVRIRPAHRVRSIVVIHQDPPQVAADQSQPLADPALSTEQLADSTPADPAAEPVSAAATANPTPTSNPPIPTAPSVPAPTGSAEADSEAEGAVSPRRAGRPLTGVQRLLADGPSRNRKAA